GVAVLAYVAVMLSPFSRPVITPVKTAFASPYTRVLLSGVTVNTFFKTLIETSFVLPLKFAGSVGVNATCRFWPLPAPSTVPAAGVYTKLPGTGLPLKVAVAFSCVPLSAVPYVMSAGFVQLIVGVALFTTRVAVAVADLAYAAFAYVTSRL